MVERKSLFLGPIDFSDAEEEYQQAIEVVQTGDIADYEHGYDYLEHFL